MKKLLLVIFLGLGLSISAYGETHYCNKLHLQLEQILQARFNDMKNNKIHSERAYWFGFCVGSITEECFISKELNQIMTLDTYLKKITSCVNSAEPK